MPYRGERHLDSKTKTTANDTAACFVVILHHFCTSGYFVSLCSHLGFIFPLCSRFESICGHFCLSALLSRFHLSLWISFLLLFVLARLLFSVDILLLFDMVWIPVVLFLVLVVVLNLLSEELTLLFVLPLSHCDHFLVFSSLSCAHLSVIILHLHCLAYILVTFCCSSGVFYTFFVVVSRSSVFDLCLCASIVPLSENNKTSSPFAPFRLSCFLVLLFIMLLPYWFPSKTVGPTKSLWWFSCCEMWVLVAQPIQQKPVKLGPLVNGAEEGHFTRMGLCEEKEKKKTIPISEA